MHSHSPAASTSASRKLTIAAALMAAFVVFELAAGAWSGSLALIGDALHNLTDTVALLIALVALHLARRPPTKAKSYGYHRAGILAAFINAAALVTFSLLVFVEAFQRLREPRGVDTGTMLATAILALALNSAVTFSLHREHSSDVNIRAAVVHLFADALSSAGVIVAALLIRFTGSPMWDPGVTIVIGLLILWSGWGVLRETVNLLLDGTPGGIDPAAVTATLEEIDGIARVHHLHIWALGASLPALSCHVVVGDVPVSTTSELLTRINQLLDERYRIVHTTIQFEWNACAEDDPHCLPASH